MRETVKSSKKGGTNKLTLFGAMLFDLTLFENALSFSVVFDLRNHAESSAKANNGAKNSTHSRRSIGECAQHWKRYQQKPKRPLLLLWMDLQNCAKWTRQRKKRGNFERK
jgi:hypothetical protein